MPSAKHAGVRPGFPLYGHALGVAILDTEIPRPVGDVGNARTFDYPVDYAIAAGTRGADMGAPWNQKMADTFVRTVEELAVRGSRVAISSCGLLACYQTEVASRSPVPIAMSSLIQLPLVLRILPPEQRVLLITIRRDAVREEHLVDSGVVAADLDRVRIVGLDGVPYLTAAIGARVEVYEPDLAEEEILSFAEEEISPDIGAVVLECTNLAPFSPALRERLGVPVWDIKTLADWMAASVDGSLT